MFGLFGRGKESPETHDAGLSFADVPESGRVELGKKALEEYGTAEGKLRVTRDSLVMTEAKGDYDIPYHHIESWTFNGKTLRIWWRDSADGESKYYTHACTPVHREGAELESLIDELIHQRTFVL